MGLSLSVILANAYMEGLEGKLLTASPLKPAIWRRYVDDTWVLWQHGDDALAEFLDRMNNIHDSIKFTMETETDGKIPFLDVLVTRNASGGLDTEVYRKAIASNAYIPASSNHAQSIKRGIIKNMYDRARNVCSNASARHKEEKTLQDIFALNGYRGDFIRRCSADQPAPPESDQPSGTGQPAPPGSDQPSGTGQPAPPDQPSGNGQPAPPGSNQPPGTSQPAPPGSDQPSRTSQPAPPGSDQPSGTSQRAPPGSDQPSGPISRPRPANRPRYVSMPYVKGVSEPISRFLRAHNVIVGHSSKTLKKSLVNVKDRIPKAKQKGTIYEMQCECGEIYIGETGRPKDVRLNEHAKDIEHGRVQKSAPARHTRQCGRNMHPMEGKTLACESNWKKRIVREAIEIKEKDPYMNRDVGKFGLSPIWDFTLRNRST